MADDQPKELKDRHPEISAPILDLSLEAQIALAEQRVVERGVRLRGDAARIVGTLRSKRSEAVRWTAIGVGAVAVGAIGYAGWRAWRGSGSASHEAPSDSPRPAAGAGFATKIAALARTAVEWALRLHQEQGVTGSIFGMARSALWPPAARSTDAAHPAAAATPPRSDFPDSP